jgi:hypothetical protein
MLVLPATLERVLSKVEAGQIEVQIAEDSRNGTGRGARRRGGASRENGGLSKAAICVVSLAAGLVLMLNMFVVPAWFCFGLAGLAAASLLLRR